MIAILHRFNSFIFIYTLALTLIKKQFSKMFSLLFMLVIFWIDDGHAFNINSVFGCNLQYPFFLAQKNWVSNIFFQYQLGNFQYFNIFSIGKYHTFRIFPGFSANNTA